MLVGGGLSRGVAVMKLKISAALAAAACALAFGIGAAKADTVTTFNVSAAFGTFTLGGNIIIDVTTGTVQSEDVTVQGLPGVGPFTTNAGISSTGFGQTQLTIHDAANNNLLLFLPVSNLTGYTGGVICGVTIPPGCEQISVSVL